MTRTIISIPAEEKRWLESYGKRLKISGAEVVRKAVREYRDIHGNCSLAEVLQDTLDVGGTQVREEQRIYGSPGPAEITEIGELRRRAIEAAGRFESGTPDLSVSHDRYLAEEPEGGRHRQEIKRGDR
ncbi:MAG: hypothetical protein M0C28_40250 [Candidatus Moduliflexus flocculans]|nr:hypothetical protein [Candidatus Moduliflexus flocculans]